MKTASIEEKRKQIDELTDKMNESVKMYQNDPKDEIELLKSLSKFKNYSVRNTILAKAQYQGAYSVASYKDFQKIGYQVQKGEKSIFILAPKFDTMFKDKSNKYKSVKYATKEQKADIKSGKIKTENRLLNYLKVPVFDITQTDCPSEDYPKLYPNKPENFNFKGTGEDFHTFNRALNQYVKEQGLTVTTGKMESAAKGYFVPSTNNIILRDSLNSREMAKVLLHEMAHAEMHNSTKISTKDKDMRTVNVLEYQAEMTAFVVSNNFGLDTEDYSKNYLASWTKRDVDNSIYIKSLQEVKDVSLNMIEKVVGNYNEIKLNRVVSQQSDNEDINQYKPLEIEDKIAMKLNFLSDGKGKNYFMKLKDELLKCIGIEKIKGATSFSDYNIKLEDKDGNCFNYHIRSEKSIKEINKEWSNKMTGKEWLEQDIKTEVLKRKPTLNIDNLIPENTSNMKSIKEYTEQQIAPEIKL